MGDAVTVTVPLTELGTARWLFLLIQTAGSPKAALYFRRSYEAFLARHGYRAARWVWDPETFHWVMVGLVR